MAASPRIQDAHDRQPAPRGYFDGPKPDTKSTKARTRTIKSASAPVPVNTLSVRPAQVSTAKRLVPHRKDEPVAGFTAGIRNLDGTWHKPGVGRPKPGAYLADRPYYTDAYTTHHNAGPSGQESTQWNAAQVAKAAQIQVANYGKPGYIFRSAIPGGTNEVAPGSLAQSGLRAANVGSMLLPGGGVGEAAGILGFGLKALRGGRAVKDVAVAGKKDAPVFVRSVTHVTTPEGASAIRERGFNVKATGGIGGLDFGPGIHLADEASDTGLYWRTQLETRNERGIVPTEVIHGTVSLHKPFEYESIRYSRGGDRIGRISPREALVERAPEAVATFDKAVASGVHENRALSLAVRKAGYDGLVIPNYAGGEEIIAFHPRSVSFGGTPNPAAVVRGAMPGAKILRGKQEKGYSVERSKRVAAARVHLDNPNLSPAERVGLAKSELVGELPKINFGGFSELNDESLSTLQTHILDHPHLMPFQKIRASDALVNALGGKVPTRSEIILLEHIFGKDTARGLHAFAVHPFRDRLLSVLNVPRSLMASFDLSAPFRQGLMVSTRHPAIFARNLGPMVKTFGSEKVYQGLIDEIHARPTYPMMLEAKLPLTELGRDIGAREEQFASDYAEKLTGGKYGPVRASGRAYTGFLDKTRADVFDHLIQRAQSQGVNVQDQEFLRSLGRYIGSATGRGDLGHFQEAGKYLNAVFFSPRLLASRLNFLNPAYYARLDPFARKEALRSAVQLAGTLSVLVALASRVPGVNVATDPRNPDWGKIRVGNTRIDLAAGFQQPLRLLAQFGTGVAISSTTGKSLSLTAGGFGKPTRLDIVQRFFMGKESPIASLITDWARGTNLIGQKFTWPQAVVQRMTPLLAQDSFDLYREKHGGLNGLAAAFAGYGIGSVGIGIQTYGPVKPKTRVRGPANYFSGGSGGGSPYFSQPSGFGR